MAEPPDISDTFVREVDENLRRDQIEQFARKRGGWIAAAVVLFLAASGGFIYWQQYKQQRSEKQVEQLAQVFKDIGAGGGGAATKPLDDLSQSGSKAVGATALFTRAALALQDGDVKLAAAKYRDIANDDGMPKPYRDLALIRQIALEFDRISPQDVIGRLQPLAKPGDPWFGTAAEMTGMALIKEGKKNDAAAIFAVIAKDRTVPEPIRERAVQLAGSLGVDATSAFGAPAQ